MDWAKIENAIIQDRSLDDFKTDCLEHMRKLNNSNLGSHAAPEDNFSLSADLSVIKSKEIRLVSVSG